MHSNEQLDRLGKLQALRLNVKPGRRYAQVPGQLGAPFFYGRS
jgi:hypothetical protein